MGLKQAGFEVLGVDLVDQPEYFEPEKFVCADAFEFLKTRDISGFDLIWASPPCQKYSLGSAYARKCGKQYPDLVAPIREALLKTGKPFCIENVVCAPLRRDLMLCGEMFGLKVIRHRIFELHGFSVSQPQHQKHKGAVWNGSAVGVWGGTQGGTRGYRKMRELKKSAKYFSQYVCLSGHGGNSISYKLADKQKAMGIDWIKKHHTLNQCVPPAYSRYIAECFSKQTKLELVHA